MARTTEFDDWLSSAALESYDEIYSLYRSVNDCDEWGHFKTQQARGPKERWIVTDICNEFSLLLASEKAKRAFLTLLEKTYCDDLNMEGWHMYKREMEKD